jgi:hypothetical protein
MKDDEGATFGGVIARATAVTSAGSLASSRFSAGSVLSNVGDDCMAVSPVRYGRLCKFK